MPDPLTVLLVDDDKADRLMVRRTLREAPLPVVLIEAESAREAFDRLSQVRPDCVFVDRRLSSEDGLDLLREIRRREVETNQTQCLPVILLTGQGDETLAVEAMKADATDYIPKDEISPNRLSCAIRTGMELHRRRGEIKRAQAALRRAHDELEKRVQERTADLASANSELRRCNAELDEFSYVASHDLQEPLRKLIAFSDLLPRDLGAGLSPQAEKDLEFITEAAQRMQLLVQQLLALSRAGKNALKRERTSLSECADSAIRALEIRVQETAARITRDSLPDVLGDGVMLSQLYQNLIGNAMKFVRAGVTPQIHLTCEDSGDTWTLGVCDNGIGIAPQYADQIFAPFKRLHGRDEYEGSGIGLAICRKTVERHGGRIWVESEPERGARFKFTLAKQLEDQACPHPAASAPSSC